jgi:hypothetical protein
MLNSVNAKAKKSNVDRNLSLQVFIIFLVQVNLIKPFRVLFTPIDWNLFLLFDMEHCLDRNAFARPFLFAKSSKRGFIGGLRLIYDSHRKLALNFYVKELAIIVRNHF